MKKWTVYWSTMARSKCFSTNVRKSPRLQISFFFSYFFFYSAPLVLALIATCEEPERVAIFFYSSGIWTPHLQQPGDWCPEVLNLQPRYRKWTHLWADVCSFVLAVNMQGMCLSKANRDGTFLPQVCSGLSLIIHCCFLLPNIASKTAICCPVFSGEPSWQIQLCFPPWLQQIFVDHGFGRHAAGLWEHGCVFGCTWCCCSLCVYTRAGLSCRFVYNLSFCQDNIDVGKSMLFNAFLSSSLVSSPL